MRIRTSGTPRWWAAGILATLAATAAIAARGRQPKDEGRVPDLRGWHHVQLPGLVVASDAGARETEQLAQHVTALRTLFSSLWPAASPEARPVVVFALRGESGLRRLMPEIWATPRHVRPAGVFVRGLDRDYLAIGLHGPQTRWFDILDHEYGHLLVDRHLERLPVWLDEGLAELVSRGSTGADAAAGRATYAALLDDGPLLPLSTLLHADRSSSTDPLQSPRFYAQAWALTHYLLVADGGARADRLTAFITLLRRGVPDAQAATTAFGDLSSLQSRLARYVYTGALARPLTPMLPTLPGGRPRAVPLPAAEGWLLLGDFFEHSAQSGLADETLTRALAAGAGARAIERLGLARLRRQRFAHAERLAGEALALDAELAIARYVRAVAVMAQAPVLPSERATQAEADLRGALQRQPGLARAHAVLGGLLATSRGRPQDGIEHARLAVSLEPSDVAHRIALAQVLLLDGQPAEARWLASQIVSRAASESERAIGERLIRLADDTATTLAREDAIRRTIPDEATPR